MLVNTPLEDLPWDDPWTDDPPDPQVEAAWVEYDAWLAAGRPEDPDSAPDGRFGHAPLFDWGTTEPSGVLWCRLENKEPGSLFDRTERIAGWARLRAAADGHILTEIALYHAAYGESPLSENLLPGDLFDSAAASLSAATKVATRTAKSQLGNALELAERLPATLTALREGRINGTTAEAIRDETQTLSDEDCATVEDRLFPAADEQFPAQARAAARREAIAADPATAAKRWKKARTGRRVMHTPAPDGMSWLSAFMPAETGSAVFGVIDAHARACRGPEDTRGIDERRADALADLILHPLEEPGPQMTVHLHVVVTAGSLLGLSGEPAELAGYGPITPDLARTLAGDAVWSRILTDPAGEVLETGARQYTPSAATKRRVRARDRHCRFPGCRQPRMDLDHTIPHGEDGFSDETNLSGLCRFHHRVKHLKGWGKTQAPGGVLTWTTPDGHTYTTLPPPLPGHDPTPSS